MFYRHIMRTWCQMLCRRRGCGIVKDCRTAFSRDMTILLTMQFAAWKIYELCSFEHPTVGPFLQLIWIAFDFWGGIICDANCLLPSESAFECMKLYATKFDSERATARHRHSINKIFPALNESVCVRCTDKVFSVEFPWINKRDCKGRGASACHSKFP